MKAVEESRRRIVVVGQMHSEPAHRTAAVLRMMLGLRLATRLAYLRCFTPYSCLPWPRSCVLCAAASAAVPEIDQFTPRGGQRGTEVEVIFSGQRLGDARGLLFYEPGIAVKSLEVLPDKRVKTRLALAGDCPLGPHALRLQSATRHQQPGHLQRRALPEVNEIKPNNDFAKPQKISLNTTVNGVVLNEDVDYYAVEAKKGQRLSVEVEGLRLGESFFDPSVAILDTNRFVLAAADDTPLLRQDCACSVIVPRDGTYVIQVRESAFGGSDRCHYRLHVGTFPRPLAVFPAGGKFGQTVDVTYIGDAGGPIAQKLTLPPGPQPGFAAWAQDAQGMAPSPNPFRLSPLENVLEKEPNNDAQHATPFTAPAALNGVIDPPGDTDCWVFSAKKGQTFDVRVFARQLRTPLDSTLNISRIKGQFIAYNDDSNGPDSYIRFTAPEDDQYVISITDQMGRGGPDFVYRVEVTPVEPRLTIGLPERSSYVDMVAPVPKGNRIALMVSGQREDFGGEVALEMQDLPEKVAAQMLPIAGRSKSRRRCCFRPRPMQSRKRLWSRSWDGTRRAIARSRAGWCRRRCSSAATTIARSGATSATAWPWPLPSRCRSTSRSCRPRFPWCRTATWN